MKDMQRIKKIVKITTIPKISLIGKLKLFDKPFDTVKKIMPTEKITNKVIGLLKEFDNIDNQSLAVFIFLKLNPLFFGIFARVALSSLELFHEQTVYWAEYIVRKIDDTSISDDELVGWIDSSSIIIDNPTLVAIFYGLIKQTHPRLRNIFNLDSQINIFLIRYEEYKK